MPQKSSHSTDLYLKCEIIETFESDGKTLAKIKFDPGLMEVIIDPMKQYHLGDALIVNGKLTIEKIEQKNSEVI